MPHFSIISVLFAGCMTTEPPADGPRGHEGSEADPGSDAGTEGEPMIEVDRDEMVFDVTPGYTVVDTVTITNAGEGILELDVEVVGPDDIFRSDFDGLYTLEPGDSLQGIVRAQPIEPGEVTGELSLSSNDPDLPDYVVPLLIIE